MRRVLLSAFFAAAAAQCLAHHGRRFFLLTEFEMPHSDDFYFVSDFGALRFESQWRLESSPGFLFGVGNHGRSAIEVHGHFEKDGAQKWMHEATGIELRHRLNDSPGWNFAVGAEAEFPASGGPTGLSARLIAGKEDAKGAFMLNLIAEKAEGLDGKTTWSYAAGWSPASRGPVGWSVEAAGGFQSGSSHELLLGAAKSVGESTLLKVGVGVGLTKDSPDWTVRAGIVMKI